MWIARARTDDVGCVHYISTVHSCDVTRVLYGNTMNSFWPITARAFLWTFYEIWYTQPTSSVWARAIHDTFYKRNKNACSSGIIELYKHLGIFKNTREVREALAFGSCFSAFLLKNSFALIELNNSLGAFFISLRTHCVVCLWYEWVLTSWLRCKL